MKVGDILRVQQPGVYKQLNRNNHQYNNRKHKKEREDKNLSFSDVDKMMRHNKGVNESRCR